MWGMHALVIRVSAATLTDIMDAVSSSVRSRVSPNLPTPAQFTRMPMSGASRPMSPVRPRIPSSVDRSAVMTRAGVESPEATASSLSALLATSQIVS